MPPDGRLRLLGVGHHLPGAALPNEALADTLGTTAEEITRRTGVTTRHHAPAGAGPSDLALQAAQTALREAGVDVGAIGLIVFATTTPDVTFPGAACYLQEKLGAGTVGALDVRAQSAGFLCALDVAVAFGSLPGSDGGPDARYARILIAAGEVLSSGLDFSPRGAELTPRLADGAGAVVVGRGARGPQVHAVRWYTEGTLADRFWCEFPASYQYPVRITAENLAAGKHYPTIDLPAVEPVVGPRLEEAAREVLGLVGWQPAELDLAIVDFVAPGSARAAAERLGIPSGRIVVPTADFGHVMAGGLVIALARALPGLRPGARVLLAAAGPGLAWGAAALEV